jgi:hypothetical protein
MSIDELQKRYMSRMKNRAKSKKIGIIICVSEEMKNARKLEIVGDCYSHKARSEELTKKWKQKNKKG